MTPQELFKYADRFASRSEAKDQGTQYPTFREIAKRFKVTYDEIEDVVASGQGMDGCGDYFGVSIGVQIQGVGYAEHGSRGEWQVEAQPRLVSE
jgi:hypothetical protein